MNPGPVIHGSVNARSIWNKDIFLTDTIASHTFDFLCLTETHIRTTDLDSFLRSLSPDVFSLIHRPCSSGLVVVLVSSFVFHTNIARWILQIIAPLKILSYQSQFCDEFCS